MEDNPLTFEEQEKFALENYDKERIKMSDALYKPMQKKSRKDALLESVAGGALLAIISALLLSQTYARTPQYDPETKITEYKFNKKRMSEAMLKSIVICTLVMLSYFGVRCIAYSQENHGKSDMLRDDVFAQYFGKALMKYKGQTHILLSAERAAALIINNMLETEVARLHALATDGLVHNKNGHYYIRDENIAAAAQIISNQIRYNKALENAVIQIMHGREPTTYFIAGLHQKTR